MADEQNNQPGDQVSGENGSGNLEPAAPDAGSDQGGANSPTHVVGIGASAGGLEACQEFFQNCPLDTGAAFVVVQHLSPDFRSLMDELLNRHTEMPVSYAIDGEQVLANHVYLISPRKNLRIAEGRLLLSDQVPNSGLNFPIDTFFRSLAEDQQHKGVGIVLSGTGSDGTRGITAIKETGGLVIVQTPSSAQFDGMPRSAAATGKADLMLPPKEMPAALYSYFSHPLIVGEPDLLKQHLQEREGVLEELFQRLYEVNEIDFKSYKPTTIARRIERRMGINQLQTLDEYLELLRNSPQETKVLAKELLIGVTRFFRDPEAFEALFEQVLPALVKETKPGTNIRVWVAGCSTGEEAYSIAIGILETLEALQLRRQVKVFATDVDSEAISFAGTGAYPVTVADDVDEGYLNKYFNLQDGKFVVSSMLRQTVVFAVHNLISDPPFSNIDLVSCRNTLIYLQSEAQYKALSLFHFALRLNGILFLGSSESLGGLKNYFSIVDTRLKIFRKAVEARLMLDSPVADRLDRRREQSGPGVGQMMANHRPMQKQGDMHRVTQRLLENYLPPSIVLNEKLEAVHTFGDTSPYLRKLKPGKVSLAIRDLVDESILMAVSTAVHRALKSQQDVHYANVRLGGDDSSKMVDLGVEYIADPSGALTNLVLTFSDKCEQQIEAREASGTIQLNVEGQTGERVAELERELRDSREHLHSTVEELETTNEELQSTNEELMAANEELQSTNEELQSVNEELYTVNNEHQLKIEELTQANADLDNYIMSTQIGTIFLAADLKVRKFTPAATTYFNLLPLDIGRPFEHISHKLNIDDLISRIRGVLARHEKIEQEVTTVDGVLAQLRILPYIKADGAVGGAVLTVVDISQISEARKQEWAVSRMQQDLNRLRTRCDLVKRLSNYGCWSWDIRSDRISCDDTACELFGTEPGSLHAYQSFLALLHPQDRDRVRDAISRGLDSKDPMFLMHRVVWQDGSVHWIQSSGIVVHDDEGMPIERIGIFVECAPDPEALADLE